MTTVEPTLILYARNANEKPFAVCEANQRRLATSGCVSIFESSTFDTYYVQFGKPTCWFQNTATQIFGQFALPCERMR